MPPIHLFPHVISYACPCVCVYVDERVFTVHVCSGLCYTSRIVAVFKGRGQKQRSIIEQVRLPFEGLTNDFSHMGSLWVCVQNIAEAVVLWEVATAVAIEVWEE